MEELINKYSNKLFKQGLTEKDASIFGALETEIIWNKKSNEINILNKIFDNLNINTLLFSTPAEPYKTIINYLTGENLNAIYPEDCETRTFLHDLPVTDNFESNSISKELKHRKSVIVKNKGIITYGTVSPEQAFVTYSSICFACFVKFFSDYIKYKKKGKINKKLEKTFNKVIDKITLPPETFPPLMKSPFNKEDEIYLAIIRAGKLVVEYKLVDSYFGNISYFLNNTIYISQTASSLDELEGCIDPCPIDNSSCAGITASSELSAHKQVYLETDNRAILHGHPKFSVILSLDCDKSNCKYKNECHIKCPEERFINDIPIVPGEVGTGKYGLCNTMPRAMKGRRGVIVYGHGLFTASKDDFNESFKNLLEIERECQKEYFERVK